MLVSDAGTKRETEMKAKLFKGAMVCGMVALAGVAGGTGAAVIAACVWGWLLS